MAAGCECCQCENVANAQFQYPIGNWQHWYARNGFYGALGNTSVPAANRTAHITGPGILNVLGDGSGLTVIFR